MIKINQTTMLKIGKRLIVAYIILFIISQILSSCFSFRMNQQEIDKAFAGFKQKPIQHQIEVQGTKMNFAEIGNDSLPVAFFVHGSPGSWSAFIDFMKDTFLLKKVKIVSVDRIGFGKSELGEGEKSLQTQVELLKPIVAYQKRFGKKIILIGHSLGGPVIAKMAMEYPELIDKLIIVAGSIAPDLEPNEKWFRIPMAFTPIRVLIPASFRASNDEILYLKPELEKMLPLWKNIRQPVIVIQGGKDMLVNPKNADFAKKMLVNSSKVEIIRVDTMNHFVPWSHPFLIKKAIS
ncbi:alpha/beta fold hydrolase [Arcicella rosea]|uniref:Pimeloyl-ACP methyl ester carboxylesterase n=1 Tax=Arcicella rosea TaxID=502909 RepID=A0A841EEN4_9BACT|nr:alpha/beta hydrolase [Arcicella rosea]MBB6001605.1 pimeloyl-ACP methyl ester carboxylesterase [Arcicella rosea]